MDKKLKGLVLGLVLVVVSAGLIAIGGKDDSGGGPAGDPTDPPSDTFDIGPPPPFPEYGSETEDEAHESGSRADDSEDNDPSSLFISGGIEPPAPPGL